MRTSGTGNSNKTKGMTLVELGVVLFLVTLFSAILIPLLPWRGDGMETSVRRLSGTFKYLYNEAALSGTPCRLVFDLENGAYWGEQVTQEGATERLKGFGKKGRLDDSVRFRDVIIGGRDSSGGEFIAALIHPTGWIDETIVHLREETGREMTLRISPLTGAAEAYEGYVSF